MNDGAGPIDPHVAATVDHDFVDERIGQQLIEHVEARQARHRTIDDGRLLGGVRQRQETTSLFRDNQVDIAAYVACGCADCVDRIVEPMILSELCHAACRSLRVSPEGNLDTNSPESTAPRDRRVEQQHGGDRHADRGFHVGGPHGVPGLVDEYDAC